MLGTAQTKTEGMVAVVKDHHKIPTKVTALHMALQNATWTCHGWPMCKHSAMLIQYLLGGSAHCMHIAECTYCIGVSE